MVSGAFGFRSTSILIWLLARAVYLVLIRPLPLPVPRFPRIFPRPYDSSARSRSRFLPSGQPPLEEKQSRHNPCQSLSATEYRLPDRSFHFATALSFSSTLELLCRKLPRLLHILRTTPVPFLDRQWRRGPRFSRRRLSSRSLGRALPLLQHRHR